MLGRGCPGAAAPQPRGRGSGSVAPGIFTAGKTLKPRSCVLVLFSGRTCSYPHLVSGAAVPSLGMHCVRVAGREQRGNEGNRNSPAWQVVGLEKKETGLWAAVQSAELFLGRLCAR